MFENDKVDEAPLSQQRMIISKNARCKKSRNAPSILTAASSATCAAAMHGNMDVLEFLYAQRCPMNEAACNTAAQDANVAVLAWLRKKGCRWTKRTATCAAMSRSLPTLKFCITNGRQ
jgi:hypothetical protein